jgi:hypothetical protein
MCELGQLGRLSGSILSILTSIFDSPDWLGAQMQAIHTNQLSGIASLFSLHLAQIPFALGTFTKRFWNGRLNAGVRLLFHCYHARVRDRKLEGYLIRHELRLVNMMNLCRLLALLGITVSIMKLIYQFHDALQDFMFRILEVIGKLVVWLHRWGIFEAGVWAVSIALMLDSTACPPASSVFAALASVSIAAPALAYSALVNAASIKPLPWNDRRSFCQLISAYAAATLAPLAVFHQSVMVGWFTVIAMYVLIGCSVAACGGLYVFATSSLS